MTEIPFQGRSQKKGLKMKIIKLLIIAIYENYFKQVLLIFQMQKYTFVIFGNSLPLKKC